LFAGLTFLSVGVAGPMAIVEIEKPQVAKTVAVVVNDPSGAALPDVTVEERSDDWKTVLRSTETDERGRFHFSPGAKTVYYLEFSRAGFNWLRIKLQIQKKAKRLVTVTMPIGT
jgi:Carboxypeptidase regulatory-like domain